MTTNMTTVTSRIKETFNDTLNTDNLKAIPDRAREAAAEFPKRATAMWTQVLGNVAHALNLATKDDMNALAHRLDVVSRRVDRTLPRTTKKKA